MKIIYLTEHLYVSKIRTDFVKLDIVNFTEMVPTLKRTIRLVVISIVYPIQIILSSIFVKSYTLTFLFEYLKSQQYYCMNKTKLMNLLDSIKYGLFICIFGKL